MTLVDKLRRLRENITAGPWDAMEIQFIRNSMPPSMSKIQPTAHDIEFIKLIRSEIDEIINALDPDRSDF
jgi:hypothetical protein